MLLTDLHMPGMDGYQLARAIRASECGTGRRIPIVALTANTLKGEADRCRAAGMDDYLGKPLQLADLQAMLEARLPGTTTRLYPRHAARTAGTAGSTPVDLGVLQDLVGNDPAVVHGFLQGFQASAAEIVLALVEACAAGDTPEAIAQAHKLKSSARTVGALALGELCERIEAAGKARDHEALERLLPAFEREAAMVAAWLAALPPPAGEPAHG
jgi:HPt (histidine-containing phosphotransfer) domain-containing protein